MGGFAGGIPKVAAAGAAKATTRARAPALPASRAAPVDTSGRKAPGPEAASAVFGHYAEPEPGSWTEALSEVTAASALATRVPPDLPGAESALQRAEGVLAKLADPNRLAALLHDSSNRTTAGLLLDHARGEVTIARRKLKLSAPVAWDAVFTGLRAAKEYAAVSSGTIAPDQSKLVHEVAEGDALGREIQLAGALAPLAVPLLVAGIDAAIPYLVIEAGYLGMAGQSALAWILANPASALLLAETSGWIALDMIDAGGPGPYLEALTSSEEGRTYALVQILMVVLQHKSIEFHDAALEGPPSSTTSHAPEGGHVDVHNHVMGVAPTQYFIDQAGGGDAEVLYERMRQRFADNPKLKQKEPDGWKVIERTEQSLAKGGSPAERRAIFENATHDLLGAYTGTSFNDTYGPRDDLVRQHIDPGGGPLENYLTHVHEMLAEEGIGYSEQSVSLNKLERDFPEPTVNAARARAQANGKDTDVRFLAMVQTGYLASESTEGPKNLPKFDKVVDRLKVVLERPSVKGVDFAGPERGAFTEAGLENFEKTYDVLKEMAKKRGCPLVLRPHVGEGYNEGGPESRAHVQTARKNVQMLIDKLDGMGYSPEKAKEDGVVIRFGHATHATPEQIEKMKSLGVIMEANIGSNVVTRSISSASEHPLLYALYFEEETLLGTDGQGVMGTNIESEYVAAEDLIDLFRSGKTTMKLGTKTVHFSDLSAVEKERFDIQRLRGWAQKYRAGVAAGDLRDKARKAPK